MNHLSKATSTLGLLLLVLGCVGCAHFDPTRVQEDFGKSHETMLAGQYFDPQAAKNPSPDAPTGMDGTKGTKILQTYREDVSKRDFENTQQPITVLTTTAE